MSPESQQPWRGFEDRRQPHPAPAARVVLMLIIVLGVLAAFGLLIWMAIEIRTLTDSERVPTVDDVTRAARLFRIVAWVMAASVIGIAIWIGHFAWRVQRSGVFPPPGSRHLRVRTVRRDAAAQRVARLYYVIAVLLFLVGLALAPMMMRVLASLGLPAG